MEKLVAMILVLISIAVLGGVTLYYTLRPSGVKVFHAGSLAKPFKAIDEEAESFSLLREPSGSVEVMRKITEQGKKPDIAAVSDYSLIPDYLFRENLTDWYLQFARNEIVLVYSEKESAYAGEINENNWYKILSRPGVEFAFGDPNADPGGYRAMMTTQLAEVYYDNSEIFDELIASNTTMEAPSERNGSYIVKAKELTSLNPSGKVTVGPMEVAVIPSLEKGSVDYMFNYRSIAEQHGFEFVRLPSQINLSEVKYGDLYETVGIELTEGTVKKGKPIVYGITILKKAKNREKAIEFVKYLITEKGKTVFEIMGQPPISPPVTNSMEKIPIELQDKAVEE